MLTTVDVLVGVEYNLVGNIQGNYTLAYAFRKIGNDMYLNDTTITIGSFSLQNSLFKPNLSSLDYVNVSVASGQTLLNGTIVDFLCTPARLNVSSSLLRPSPTSTSAGSTKRG